MTTLGERTRAAGRTHRVAEAIGADVIIDLDRADVGQLVHDHRRALARIDVLEAEVQRLRGVIAARAIGGTHA